MILTCSLYTELRETYIPYMVNSNYDKFIYLSTKNPLKLTNLACFLLHCFKLREVKLGQMTKDIVIFY